MEKSNGLSLDVDGSEMRTAIVFDGRVYLGRQDRNIVKEGSVKYCMLRALYDFQAPYDGTLSFAENEQFLVLKRSNKDTNWVHVINQSGLHGYVPANYVTMATTSSEDVLGFADKVLEILTNDDKLSPKEKAPLVENLHEIQATCRQELTKKGSDLFYQLATIVRNNTDCQFDDAVSASFAVLDFLKNNIENVAHMLEADPNRVEAETRLKTRDGNLLTSLVETVMEVADDREISVDEDVWKDLLQLVTHADSLLCIEVLERYDCAPLLRLIQHLQAETNCKKRLVISEILFNVLQLHPKFVHVAMNSVLPTELARDMETHKKEALRVHWSIQLLLLALCGHEPLSIQQREVFGKHFVSFLLELLEMEAQKRAEDLNGEVDYVHDITNIILAVNLQYRKFLSEEENPVTSCLATRGKADCLVEKVILLFNREEDPLRSYGRSDVMEPDSITQFMLVLFSHSTTGKIMYTADLQVVLDVMLRQLQDYGPGENKRSLALNLYHSILQTSSYWEEPYRLEDFSKTLTLISEEQTRLGVTDLAMQNDRVAILKIFHEFPSVLTLNCE